LLHEMTERKTNAKIKNNKLKELLIKNFLGFFIILKTQAE